MAEYEEVRDIIEKNLGNLYCLGGIREHKLVFAHEDRYPHPDGLLAEDGNRYWLIYRCSLCGYENAWWKILRQLKK